MVTKQKQVLSSQHHESKHKKQNPCHDTIPLPLETKNEEKLTKKGKQATLGHSKDWERFQRASEMTWAVLLKATQ
jgi:hypothetical protein